MSAVPYTATRCEYHTGSTDILYVGKAVPGKLDSDVAWQIIRVTKSPTGVKTEYAQFQNESHGPYHAWTDRESLTYK